MQMQISARPTRGLASHMGNKVDEQCLGSKMDLGPGMSLEGAVLSWLQPDPNRVL